MQGTLTLHFLHGRHTDDTRTQRLPYESCMRVRGRAGHAGRPAGSQLRRSQNTPCRRVGAPYLDGATCQGENLDMVTGQPSPSFSRGR